MPTAPMMAPRVSFVDSENLDIVSKVKEQRQGRRVRRLFESLPDNSANRPTLRDGCLTVYRPESIRGPEAVET
jgi:hypothetical protein